MFVRLQWYPRTTDTELMESSNIDILFNDQVPYIAMLEMEDHQQTMCIEEQRTMVEPVEELEEVTLDESRPE